MEPGRLRRRRRAGNLRLDNGAASGGALGLEVRWSQVKGKLTDADLEKRLEPFFKTDRQKARKKKAVAETKSKAAHR